jgi:glycosyltransferase involved in cell wall biosynthesis
MTTTITTKRVLHVMNGAAGGSALSTLALIDQLEQRGISSAVVCLPAGSAEEREALEDATHGASLFLDLYLWHRKIRAPRWKRPLLEGRQVLRTGATLRSTARLASFARQQNVDLIHTNTLLTPEGGTAARLLGLPHVWHVRELVGEGTAFRFPIEGKPLGWFLAQHASVMVANSRTTGSRIERWLPPGVLDVVPNGIDLGRFRPRALGRPSERVVVAMVASLTSMWKKHAMFIDAAAAVDRSLPVEFRIYGHDPGSEGRAGSGATAYAAELHDRVQRHGIAGRFTFAGFVPDPARIMDEIDVLAHPADLESFGRIAVEAMAAALPVIGTRGGGVGEIVEHEVSGLLVPNDDAAAMARAIEDAVGDRSRRERWGAAGRRIAEARYSMGACADGMMRVYGRASERPLGLLGPTAPPGR